MSPVPPFFRADSRSNLAKTTLYWPSCSTHGERGSEYTPLPPDLLNLMMSCTCLFRWINLIGADDIRSKEFFHLHNCLRKDCILIEPYPQRYMYGAASYSNFTEPENVKGAQESNLPAYVAWRESIPGLLKGLQIRVLLKCGWEHYHYHRTMTINVVFSCSKPMNSSEAGSCELSDKLTMIMNDYLFILFIRLYYHLKHF